MLSIVPLINRIIETEDMAYVALDSNDEVIFVSNSLEIAQMYYAVPELLERQAFVIKKLQEQIDAIAEEYNAIVMGMIPSGSNLFH
jgi:hypothetical protein